MSTPHNDRSTHPARDLTRTETSRHPRPRGPGWRRAGGALAGVALFACAAPPARIVVHQRPTPTPLSALAVLPVDIAFDADPFEVARRTGDILDSLWHETRWVVLSPLDFVLRSPRPRDFRHDTDLVLLGQRMGITPQRLAVLETRVALREAAGQAVVQGGGGAAVGQDYRAQVSVAVRLRRVDGTLLAEVVSTAEHDPFRPHPDYDPTPAVRTALRAALTLLAATGREWLEASSPRTTFDWTANPAGLLELPGGSDTTVREMLRHRDPLDREQLIWRFMQYSEPELTPRRAWRLFEMPPAACVRGIPPPGFHAGDCVTAVNGAPISGPHALRRSLCRGRPLSLSVWDDGGTRRTVHLPTWPPPPPSGSP